MAQWPPPRYASDGTVPFAVSIIFLFFSVHRYCRFLFFVTLGLICIIIFQFESVLQNIKLNFLPMYVPFLE